nr:hypothetical protein [Tanacetum cinerariifolium]
MEPSRSVPEEPTRSVPKKPSRSVSKEPTRSVPMKPSRLVPEEPTRSVPKEPSRSVPEEPTRSVPKEPLKSLEANFSEFRQTNHFAEVVSNIPGIVHQYMNQQMNEARSDKQRNLYKALVDAYEADKTILDSYGETVILKRRRDDDDDQEEGPSAGSDQGSKRRREGKEPESASAPLETATRSAGRSTIGYLRGGASSRKYTTSVTKTKAADYGNIKWIEDLVPRSMWIYEPINYDKHAFWGVSHWGRKRQQFYGFAVNQESTLNVYSKRRIITVTDLKIVEWHSYKHLDWITVCRDDDKLYKFKEGDFKRLRL